MGSEPNNETSNIVHDPVNSSVVQTESIENLTVEGRDRRTVPLLALILVVVVAAAAVIVWLVREPKPEGDPLAADTSVGLACLSNAGWVIPDPGPQPIPYVERPQNAVLGSGGVVTVTMQGLSGMAVVLHSLRAEVISRKPAATGVLLPSYCATDVVPRFFAVDLSASSPVVTPVPGEHNGQKAGPRDLPVKVDPTDVEQLVVRVDSPTEDVEWVLWVRWTSGASSGEFRIDDKGKPFRTTATTRTTKWCAYPGPRQGVEWGPSCA